MAQIKIINENGKAIYPATICEGVVVNSKKKKLSAVMEDMDATDAANSKAIADEATRAKGAEGTLSDLTTTEKGSLVGAVNEVKAASDEIKTTLESVKALSPEVEGWVKVSGISDPAFQTEYKKTNGDSVFDDWRPCLIEQGTGNVLKWLNPLNFEEDENGNTAKIDGTEGEVMIAPKTDKYAVLGRKKVGSTYYEVFLWSNGAFSWQGYAAEKVDRLAASPHYCVVHKDDDNVTRMHSVYNTEWNGSAASNMGVFTGLYVYTQGEDGTLTETYDDTMNPNRGAAGKGTTGYSLGNGELYARNMNSDTTKTYPFYNSTAREVELFGSRMWAEFGTYDVHNRNLLGSGWCNNDAANNESLWAEESSAAVNGWRYENSAGTMVYGSFSTNKLLVSGKTVSLEYYLDDWRQPWRIMEQQRVLAYAIKNGIAELTWFAFEGAKYKWRSVDGVAGPNEGVMTAVVWKWIKTKMVSGAVDPDNDNADMSGKDFEVLTCSGVYRGRITDVGESWWTSGLIATEDENGVYTWYMQRDQKQLIQSPSTNRLTTDDPYEFEKKYEKVLETATSPREGYVKTVNDRAMMLPDTASDFGGGLHTYAAHYAWFTGAKPSAGSLAVRGFRRGGYSVINVLSSWTVYGLYSPSNGNAYVGFGTVCLLP